MSVRDIIPWGRSGRNAPATYAGGEQNPFLTLHREMNRLFDEVFRDFGAPMTSGSGQWPMIGSWPNVEMIESDRELTVTAEVPGLSEDDIEVMLDDDALILRGEKRSESEDKDRTFSERFYGRFERVIPLGSEIEQDKIAASFKNGVLTVKMPKSQSARSKGRRITINGSTQTH